MKVSRPKNDILEIFGYSPNDTTDRCRRFWRLGACPFVGRNCSKSNHDKTITYGVCSVTSARGDCIICPNRLYADNYRILKLVAEDAFGDIKCMTFQEYIAQNLQDEVIVFLGMHSGHEIGGNNFSMDWVLAKLYKDQLISYTGVEVQRLDITNNYRDTWYAYKNISDGAIIPASLHGLNWANVYKRLIPQIIRKGLIYSRSNYVKSGLYFIVPDPVYQKFEDVIGADIPVQSSKSPTTITVYTWNLGPEKEEGEIRSLEQKRKLRFKLSDFSERFISGPNLPGPEFMDNAVKKALGLG